MTEDDYHYCEDCNAREICSQYPRHGCEFKITEPKTGKWSCDEYELYHCSECGCEATWDYDYCPNCGAKMKGTDDEC